MKRWILLTAALIASPALSQTNINLGGISTDPSAPVEVAADSLSVDQDTGTAIFDGNVVIGQGELRIAASRAPKHKAPAMICRMATWCSSATFC